MRLLGHLVGFVFGGVWLEPEQLLWAKRFAVTVIGIPFARQHVKPARRSLMPYRKTIVALPA